MASNNSTFCVFWIHFPFLPVMTFMYFQCIFSLKYLDCRFVTLRNSSWKKSKRSAQSSHPSFPSKKIKKINNFQYDASDWLFGFICTIYDRFTMSEDHLSLPRYPSSSSLQHYNLCWAQHSFYFKTSTVWIKFIAHFIVSVWSFFTEVTFFRSYWTRLSEEGLWLVIITFN